MTSPVNVIPSVTITEALPYQGHKLIEQCLNEEHAGDTRLFAALYDGRVLYDHAQKMWYLWAEHFWQNDSTQQVRRLITGQLVAQYLSLAAQLAPVVASEAKGGPASQLQTAAIKRAKALSRLDRVKSVLEMAQSLLGIEGHEWDQQPWKLAVRNGVVDLRTGELHPGAPADYIRVVAPTIWSGLDTPAPRWDQFLNEIFDGDTSLIRFVLRIFGAAISGTAQEHILAVLWGQEGRNGKDTLVKVLKAILGPYAGAVSNDVLIDQKYGRSAGSATPHLMNLRGKRVAWASETGVGARLNVAQVKHLTGGGDIPARQLHEREITFKPTHMLLLLTNDKPHIPADAHPIWERVKLIPFTQRFIDEPTRPHEHKRDAALFDTLRGEASGILAALVRGCLDWQASGLGTPECVKQATTAYRDEEDVCAQFVAQRCVRDKYMRVGAHQLYKVYRQWAEETDTYPIFTEKRFGLWMVRHFERKKGSGGNVYLGIGLLVDAHTPAPDDSTSVPKDYGRAKAHPTKPSISRQDGMNSQHNGHHMEGVEGSMGFSARDERSQAKKPHVTLHTLHTLHAPDDETPFPPSQSPNDNLEQSSSVPAEARIPDGNWGTDDDRARLARELAEAGQFERALWVASEIQNTTYQRDVKRDVERKQLDADSSQATAIDVETSNPLSDPLEAIPEKLRMTTRMMMLSQVPRNQEFARQRCEEFGLVYEETRAAVRAVVERERATRMESGRAAIESESWDQTNLDGHYGQ